MMGTPASIGLTPRICEGLFSYDEGSPETPNSFRVEVSFLEIYNERVRDLLHKSEEKKPYTLRVREHPERGPYVQGLSQHVVTSYEQVVALLEEGMENRITAATHIHDASSRSHAIFTIQYTQAMLEDNLPTEITSKINLVDLAGSERASPEYCKDRLTEGSNINRSLVTLGIVISTLAQNSQMTSSCQSINSIASDGDSGSPSGGSTNGSKRQPYVPYRDSILTWLLKDSLGGNSKTIMIATVSPASSSYNETMSTLRYASHAKNIVNKPRVNEDANVKLIRDLREEINRLKNMIQSFEIRTISPSFSDEKDGNFNELVKQNELKIERLTKDWTEKWTDKEAIMEKYNVDISQGKAGLTIDSNLPYLIAMDDDILSTRVVIYQLKEGNTNIGRCDSEQDQDIALQGEWIEREHCMIHNCSGVVELQPVQGAQCTINGQEVTEACRLSQGDVLVIGKTHRFRFNNPAEAALLRQRRSDSQVSFVSSSSLDWLDLSGDFSTPSNENKLILNRNTESEDYQQKLRDLESFYQQQVQQQQLYVEDLKKQIQTSKIRSEKELELEQSLINQIVEENKQWLIKEEQRLTESHHQRRESSVQTEPKFIAEAEVQNTAATDSYPSAVEVDRKRLVQRELLRKCSLRRAERNIRRKRIKFQLERIIKKQKLLEAKKDLQHLQAVCWISEDTVKQLHNPDSEGPSKGVTRFKQSAFPCSFQTLPNLGTLKRKCAPAVSLHSNKPSEEQKPRRAVSVECLSSTCCSGLLSETPNYDQCTVQGAEKHPFVSVTNQNKTSTYGKFVLAYTQMSKKRQKMDKSGSRSKSISKTTEPLKKRNSRIPITTANSETKLKPFKSSPQQTLESRRKSFVQENKTTLEKNEATGKQKNTKNIQKTVPPGKRFAERSSSTLKGSKREADSCLPNSHKKPANEFSKISSSTDSINTLSRPTTTHAIDKRWQSTERLSRGLLKPKEVLLQDWKEDDETGSSDSESFYSVDSLSSAYGYALTKELHLKGPGIKKNVTSQNNSDSEDSEISQDSLAERGTKKEKPNRRRFNNYKTVLTPCSSSKDMIEDPNPSPVVMGTSVTTGLSKSFSLDSLADAEDVPEMDSSEEMPAEIFWKLQSPRILGLHTDDQNNIGFPQAENRSDKGLGSSFYLNVNPLFALDCSDSILSRSDVIHVQAQANVEDAVSEKLENSCPPVLVASSLWESQDCTITTANNTCEDSKTEFPNQLSTKYSTIKNEPENVDSNRMFTISPQDTTLLNEKIQSPIERTVEETSVNIPLLNKNEESESTVPEFTTEQRENGCQILDAAANPDFKDLQYLGPLKDQLNAGENVILRCSVKDESRALKDPHISVGLLTANNEDSAGLAATTGKLKAGMVKEILPTRLKMTIVNAKKSPKKMKLMRNKDTEEMMLQMKQNDGLTHGASLDKNEKCETGPFSLHVTQGNWDTSHCNHSTTEKTFDQQADQDTKVAKPMPNCEQFKHTDNLETLFNHTMSKVLEEDKRENFKMEPSPPTSVDPEGAKMEAHSDTFDPHKLIPSSVHTPLHVELDINANTKNCEKYVIENDECDNGITESRERPNERSGSTGVERIVIVPGNHPHFAVDSCVNKLSKCPSLTQDKITSVDMTMGSVEKNTEDNAPRLHEPKSTNNLLITNSGDLNFNQLSSRLSQANDNSFITYVSLKDAEKESGKDGAIRPENVSVVSIESDHCFTLSSPAISRDTLNSNVSSTSLSDQGMFQGTFSLIKSIDSSLLPSFNEGACIQVDNNMENIVKHEKDNIYRQHDADIPIHFENVSKERREKILDGGAATEQKISSAKSTYGQIAPIRNHSSVPEEMTSSVKNKQDNATVATKKASTLEKMGTLISKGEMEMADSMSYTLHSTDGTQDWQNDGMKASAETTLEVSGHLCSKMNDLSQTHNKNSVACGKLEFPSKNYRDKNNMENQSSSDDINALWASGSANNPLYQDVQCFPVPNICESGEKTSNGITSSCSSRSGNRTNPAEDVRNAGLVLPYYEAVLQNELLNEAKNTADKILNSEPFMKKGKAEASPVSSENNKSCSGAKSLVKPQVQCSIQLDIHSTCANAPSETRTPSIPTDATFMFEGASVPVIPNNTSHFVYGNESCVDKPLEKGASSQDIPKRTPFISQQHSSCPAKNSELLSKNNKLEPDSSSKLRYFQSRTGDEHSVSSSIVSEACNKDGKSHRNAHDTTMAFKRKERIKDKSRASEDPLVYLLQSAVTIQDNLEAEKMTYLTYNPEYISNSKVENTVNHCKHLLHEQEMDPCTVSNSNKAVISCSTLGNDTSFSISCQTPSCASVCDEKLTASAECAHQPRQERKEVGRDDERREMMGRVSPNTMNNIEFMCTDQDLTGESINRETDVLLGKELVKLSKRSLEYQQMHTDCNLSKTEEQYIGRDRSVSLPATLSVPLDSNQSSYLKLECSDVNVPKGHCLSSSKNPGPGHTQPLKRRLSTPTNHKNSNGKQLICSNADSLEYLNAYPTFNQSNSVFPDIKVISTENEIERTKSKVEYQAHAQYVGSPSLSTNPNSNQNRPPITKESPSVFRSNASCIFQEVPSKAKQSDQVMTENKEIMRFSSSDINPFVHSWQLDGSGKGRLKQCVFNSTSDVSCSKFQEQIMRCSSVDEGLNAHVSPFHSHLSSYANAKMASSTISSTEDVQIRNNTTQDFQSTNSLDGSSYYYPLSDEVAALSYDCGPQHNRSYELKPKSENCSVQVDEIMVLYTSESETCNDDNIKVKSEQGTQTKGRYRRLNRHQRSHTDVSSIKVTQCRNHRPASWSNMQNMSLHLSQLLYETSELLGNFSEHDSGHMHFHTNSTEKAVNKATRDSSTQTTVDRGIQTDCQVSICTQNKDNEKEKLGSNIIVTSSQTQHQRNQEKQIAHDASIAKTQSLPNLHDGCSCEQRGPLYSSTHFRTSTPFLAHVPSGISPSSYATRPSSFSPFSENSPSEGSCTEVGGSECSTTRKLYNVEHNATEKLSERSNIGEGTVMVDRATSPILTLKASKKSLHKHTVAPTLNSQNMVKVLRHRSPKERGSSQTVSDSENASSQSGSENANPFRMPCGSQFKDSARKRLKEEYMQPYRFKSEDCIVREEHPFHRNRSSSISELSSIGRPSRDYNLFALKRRDKADGTSATALNAQHPLGRSPSLENLSPVKHQAPNRIVQRKRYSMVDNGFGSNSMTSSNLLLKDKSHTISISEASNVQEDELSVVESESNTDILLNTDSPIGMSRKSHNYTLQDLPIHNKFSNWSGVQCTPSRLLPGSPAQLSLRDSPTKTEYSMQKEEQEHSASTVCESRTQEIERLQRERAEIMSGIHLELNLQPLTVQLAEAKLSYGIGETDALLRVMQNGTTDDKKDIMSLKKQLYDRHMKEIEGLRKEREDRLQIFRRSRSLSPQKQLSASQGSLASLRESDLPSRRREYLQQLRKDVVDHTRFQEPKKGPTQCPSEIELMLKDYQKAREEAKSEIARARDKLRERAELERKRLQQSCLIKEDTKLKSLMSTSTLCTSSNLSLSSGPTSGYNSSVTATQDKRSHQDLNETKTSPRKMDLASGVARGRSAVRNCQLVTSSQREPVPDVRSQSQTPAEGKAPGDLPPATSHSSYTPFISGLSHSVVSYQDIARQLQTSAIAEIMAASFSNIKNLFDYQAAAGWIYQCTERDVLVYYKAFPSATKHGFLGAGVIRRPLHDVWGIVKDTDTRHLYDNSILTAQVHQRVANNIQLVYVRSDASLCYLKQPRDFCCITVESKEDAGYNLCFQSVYSESMPRPSSDTVRGELLPSAWMLQPDTINGENVTRVIYLLQVDFGAPAVPSRLLKAISKRQPLVIASLASFLSV
ncbi:stAR-related lipid transfer protein 9 isoform X2 [Xenopus laevis]|nr:stAR-related lipid transfer protein 9 isoform X2 [Xenopus laevis]